MRFLITGGSGFIGQALQHELARHSHEFTVVDLVRVQHYRTHNRAWAPVDIRHIHPLVHLLRRRGPFDAIIHLAATTDPEMCEAVAVQGTLNVITAAKRTGTPRIIFASSAEVYGAAEKPASEDAVCQPTTPLGITKLHAERDLLASGLSVCVLRLTKVVGGNPPSLMIPMGDWLLVSEVAGVIRAVAENPQISGIYNVGSGIEVDVSKATRDIPWPPNR